MYIRNKNNLIFFKYNINLNSISFKILFNALLLIVGIYFCIGIHNSISARDLMKQYRYYMLTYETQPLNAMSNLQYNTTSTKNIELFKENNLNVFYDNKSLTPSNPELKKLTDSQNYVTISDVDLYNTFDDPYLLILGAAIDPTGERSLDSIYILFNEYKFECFYGTKNRNVSKISTRKRHRRSGFLREIPIRLLPDGRYDVRIQLLNKERTILYETETLFSIVITDNQVEYNKSMLF
jgi:hypothetical protein